MDDTSDTEVRNRLKYFIFIIESSIAVASMNIISSISYEVMSYVVIVNI